MVQQQFFAKDLSFPMNKGRVLMGTSGNISKSFAVVGVLGEGKRVVERWEKWAFCLRAWYLVGKNWLPTAAAGGRKNTCPEEVERNKAETGMFYFTKFEACAHLPNSWWKSFGEQKGKHIFIPGTENIHALPTWLVPHPRPRALNLESQDLHPWVRVMETMPRRWQVNI